MGSDRSTVPPSQEAPWTGRRWAALTVVCAAMFMGVLDSTSVYAALPVIAADLGFAPAEVQWVITAYGVVVGGLLLLGGRLADYAGRRRVFIASVALFAVASLLCGLAWSSGVLIGGRVAQGVGAAVMTPAGLSMLMTIFPDGPDRNRALGIWGGLGGVGATAGLVLGGVLTDWVGWAWIFLTNVPVCAIVIVLGVILLPGSRPRRERPIDLAGAVTATGGLVLTLLALFRFTEGGWHGGVALMLGGAVVLAGLFVVVEHRGRAPLVPPRIFRSRTLVGGNIVIVIAGIAVDGLLIVVTLYVQQVLNYSALQFGLTMVIMTVTSVVGVMAGQHLVTKFGFRAVAATGMGLLALSCLLLTRLSADSTFAQDLLVGLLVFGAGMGAAFVAGQIAALAGVADHESGVAAGIEETSFAIGTTMGAAIASAVAIGYATAQTGTGTPSTSVLTDGFGVALVVLAVIAGIGALGAVTLLRGPRSAEESSVAGGTR